MANKEDLRVIKTKFALTNAFYNMLECYSLDDITVNQLCESAGVRRATFYKHFNDKNDFIIYLIKDMRDKFDNEKWNRDENPLITKEYYLRYAEAVVRYLLGREKAIRNLMKTSARGMFINMFIEQNYLETKKRLEASVKSGMRLICSIDVLASILTGGTAHAILMWFDASNRCPVEHLLSDISRFIDKVLY